MTDWRSVPGQSQRVAELLELAGIPLELDVEAICQKFVTDSADLHNYAHSDRIVYEPADEPGFFREVDQCVELYHEIKPNDDLGVQLSLKILIECKRRSGVATFVFRRPRGEPTAFPVAGFSLAGADLFDQIPPSPSNWTLVQGSVVFIKFKANSPDRVHEEDLVFASGGSIYDYILNHLSLFEEESSSASSSVSRGLLEKFLESYPHQTDWDFHAKRYVHNVSIEESVAHARETFRRGVFSMIQMYLPVICLDGPIYEATRSEPSGALNEFREVEGCVAFFRKHRWPGAGQGLLRLRTAEVPVLVTSPHHLRTFLDAAQGWFLETEAALLGSRSAARKGLLQGELYGLIRSRRETPHKSLYHSDLAFGDLANW